MKKKFAALFTVIVLSVICTATIIATTSSFYVSAAETLPNTSSQSTTEQPTIDWKPGVYPVDGDHFIIVYPDHTFKLMHGEPPTTRPWTIA